MKYLLLSLIMATATANEELACTTFEDIYGEFTSGERLRPVD